MTLRQFVRTQPLPNRGDNEELTAGQGAALLGLLLCTPSVVQFLLNTSSHTPGLLVASMLMLAVFPYFPMGKFLAFYFFIGAVIAGHLMITAGLQPVDFGRAGISLIVLSVMLIAATCVSGWLFSLPDEITDRMLALLRLAMIVVALFGMLDVQPPVGIWAKPVFPFTEPSHWSVVFTPLLIHACVRAKSWGRYAWIVVGLLIAYFLQNLTLLVGVAIAAAASLSIIGLIASVIMVIAAASVLDVRYFTDRLDLTVESQNLSVLVYLQGWEFIQDSFERTGGWGLGFQQLGLGYVNSSAADQMYRISGLELNLQDGGFLAAKVISEFGALGLLMVALFAVLAALCGLTLRRIARKRISASSGYAFALAIICSFTVDVFVRGLAYFASSTLLFLSAWIYLRNSQIKIPWRKRSTAAAPRVAVTN